MRSFMLLFWSSVSSTLLSSFSALDRITPDVSMKDRDSLVSEGGIFELGFFSTGISKSRYLGIWYVAAPGTVVWVANREIPLSNSLGVLKITGGGVLFLLNSTGNAVWSSKASITAENAYAQVLDSGNLVVRDSSDRYSDTPLWQSFDYPCDTFLSGMKIGKNSATGIETFLSSWRSADNPAQGEYSIHLNTHGLPQLVIRKGTTVVLRFGSWNGHSLTGNSGRVKPILTYQSSSNESEVYFQYKPVNNSILSRYVLNPTGTMQRFTWVDRMHNWVTYSTAQVDQCQNYAWCGAYGSCNSYKSPVCECLTGFNPKFPKDWSKGDWFDGCVRRTQLNCHDDGFLKFPQVKLPDTSSSLFNKTMNLTECEQLCLRNCKCTAYANLDVEGSGCLLWFGNLTDISEFSQGGQDLYVKVAASDLDNVRIKGQSNKKKLLGIIVVCGILVISTLILGLLFYMRRERVRNEELTKMLHNEVNRNRQRKEEMDLPTFDSRTIANATNNFSSDNKLGEGGFGPVYKGKLMDGQDIAVKRLSKNSGQGLSELKNEVITIAKLQHRNLVKLIGCCLDVEEKLLIYEYLPNKSLDYFIFDQTRSHLLNWQIRANIIGGIARGLLYLHQDSRMRIIHRDLKASNVLLDDNMNPKISDFGLAKTFGEDETKAKTNRIVGTYGYMPPEYVVHGQVSLKSDVFSFGVLMLEIVSGKKNRGFSDPDHQLNLIGHAWRLWVEERPLELIDGSIGHTYASYQVLRYIHIGLLCAQQSPEDRPDMSFVVVMLGSDSKMPNPKQPAYYVEESVPHDLTAVNHESCSENKVTISLLQPR